MLGSTVFQPTFASLSHTFDRKSVILVSIVLFTIGAIVAATAHNVTTLLVGRSIQGVGGGGIISITEVLLTDLIPLRERGKWFGLQSLMWAIGSVTGPIVGGAFTQNVTWRWIFWINLPFCGIGLVGVPIFLRLRKRSGLVRERLRIFDWVGAFLLTTSITSFLMPITWGGITFPWSSWHTLVPLILGVFGFLGFLAYESHFALEPLIPLDIFKHRNTLVNYFGNLIQGIILWCLLYYLPLYYEAVKDYNPLIVGIAVFPETFTVTPASVIVGVVVSVTGRYRWAIWSGWFLTVLGMGLLYLLTPTTSIPSWVFINLVPGIGLGLLFSSMSMAIMAATTQKDVAFAASMYVFMRSLGQGIGIAVGGVIFQSQLIVKLLAYPTLAANATQLAQDASGLVQTIKAMPIDLPERNMIVEAYADSLKVVWAVMAGLAALAAVASAWTQGLSLDVSLDEGEQGLRDEKRRDEEGVEALRGKGREEIP